MKSPAPEKNVETNFGDFSETIKMEIESSPKVFDLIFDKVYSNKAEAVVRETLTNAEDAHREAGRMDVAIQVTVPSPLNPIFSVRDYGNSMTHEQIVSVFARPFSSTKDSSNVSTGMMGIGSKAGFAVSDTFTVTAFQGGLKRTYVCSRGADRMPGITTIPGHFDVPTDEPDGFLYSVPVPAELLNGFQAATSYLTWAFDVPIEGIVETSGYEEHLSGVSGKGFPWRVVSSVHPTGHQLKNLVVKQGPVLYPVKLEPESKIVRHGYTLVVEVPLGTVDVSPDRESLSYDTVTSSNLTMVFDDVEESIWDDFDTAMKELTWSSKSRMARSYQTFFEVSPSRYATFRQFDGKYVSSPRAAFHGVDQLFLGNTKKYGADLKAPSVRRCHPASPNATQHVYQFSYGYSPEVVYVTRPGIVREAQRIRSHWADKKNLWGYRRKTFLVLNNPTNAEVISVLKAFGKDDLSGVEIVPVASIPDPTPPEPRGPRGTSPRVKGPKKLVGVSNLLQYGRPMVESFPKDGYLWVQLTGRRADETVYVRPAVFNDTQTAYNLGRDLFGQGRYDSRAVVYDGDLKISLRGLDVGSMSTASGPRSADLSPLGLPGKVLGFTARAVELYNPDPEMEFSRAMERTVTADLVHEITDRRAYDEISAALLKASNWRISAEDLVTLGLPDHFDTVNSDGTPAKVLPKWIASCIQSEFGLIFSSVDELDRYRSVYDTFLSKYPLLFASELPHAVVLSYANSVNKKKGA